MSFLKRHLSPSSTETSAWPWARGPSTTIQRTRQTVRHSANFLDLDFDDHNEAGIARYLDHTHCLPPLRNSEGRRSLPQSRPVSSEMPGWGGISWKDFQTNDDDKDLDEKSDQCLHCNMRVVPAASRMWHQRMCQLNSGPMPACCELCGRAFGSVQHARNHYLYGCTPTESD
ncbi:hypothetical protein IW150_002271 [Coemansia sp. RSA 2607]|nr:hypothetical protein IW150_002271 [Coemansia sp. RSA 2607]